MFKSFVATLEHKYWPRILTMDIVKLYAYALGIEFINDFVVVAIFHLLGYHHFGVLPKDSCSYRWYICPEMAVQAFAVFDDVSYHMEYDAHVPFYNNSLHRLRLCIHAYKEEKEN